MRDRQRLQPAVALEAPEGGRDRQGDGGGVGVGVAPHAGVALERHEKRAVRALRQSFGVRLVASDRSPARVAHRVQARIRDAAQGAAVARQPPGQKPPPVTDCGESRAVGVKRKAGEAAEAGMVGGQGERAQHPRARPRRRLDRNRARSDGDARGGRRGAVGAGRGRRRGVGGSATCGRRRKRGQRDGA